MIAAIRNRAFWLARQVRNRWFVPKTGFEEELAAAGLSFDAWLARRRAKPRQYVELGASYLEQLRCHVADECQAAIDSAEKVLRHEFDLLGSGVFVPVDSERQARPNGYRPIDWSLDPVRNLRFPMGVPHREWRLLEMRPQNADVKYPWELARCQHFPTLGQAWKLTGDERFAREIIDEIEDFVEANPVGIGINWTCTMDVALRAANWALGLSLVLDCPAVQPAALRRAYAALFEHGRFIFENLENLYEVTSNHFLSNVVGLHFLAVEFEELSTAAAWHEFCLKALQREMEVQVLADGSDFESSIPYHRLVTELFLGSARLDSLHGGRLGAEYKAKLERMVDYLVGVLRPDGLMPQVGDADDGRLHILGGYGRWNPQDGTHLLAPAGAFFSRPEWTALAGPARQWEAAWWGWKPAPVTPAPPLPAVTRRFPDAGIAVYRASGDYLLITNGKVGTRGFGNHKHNDLLGFELHLSGIPLLVDPGSFVYTCDFDARNRLRSTAAHNTVVIDDTEQNEFNPEWLFRMFEKARPDHLDFQESAYAVIYRGRHDGYARLQDPVIHERTFTFEKESRILSIRDRFEGKGRHRLQWHFHAAPGVSVEPGEGPGVVLEAGGRRFVLERPEALTVRVITGWYSPSYGRRSEIPVLEFETETAIDGAREFEFRLLPRMTAADVPNEGDQVAASAISNGR